MNWAKIFAVINVLAAIILAGPLAAQSINWYSDIDAAKRIAAAENKPILLHFSASWCRPCQHLEKFVFNHAQVAREINEGFVPVKLDVDTYPGIAKQFQTERVPMDVILNTNGQVIQKRLSPDGVDNYLAMLRDARPVAVESTQANSQTLIAQRDQLQDRWSELRAEQQQQVAPLGGSEFRIPEFAQATKSFIPDKPTANSFASQNGFTNINQNLDSAPQANLVSPAIAVPNQPNQLDSASAFSNTGIAESRHDLNPTTASSQTGNNQLRTFDPRTDAVQDNAFGNRPIVNPFGNSGSAALSGRGEDDELFFDSRTNGTASKVASAPQSTQPSQPTPTPQPTQLATPASTPLTQTQNAFVGTHTPNFENSFSQGRPSGLQPTANPANSNGATVQNNPTSEQFALGGDCPVSLLLDNKWVPGKRELGCQHRGKLYLFASAEYLAKFQADPDGFSPLLGGFDPVIYHEQQQWVDGLREHGVFMTKEGQQSVVLFRDQQTRQKFRDEPGKYLETIRNATNPKPANPIR